MRGIGYTLSRLPQVRALLAGAAIIAGSFNTAAHGQGSGSGNGTGATTTDGTRTEEAALAMPHGFRAGGSAIALPRPLTPGDAAVMRRIFSLQQRGNIPEAIRAGNDLTNPLLMGSALADRLLGRYHRSTVAELTDWLDRYRDLADAQQIYSALQQKMPKGGMLPARPDVTALTRSAEPAPPLSPQAAERNDTPSPDRLDRAVIDRATNGQLDQALRLIRAPSTAPATAARLTGEVVRVLFTGNDDAKALRIAQDGSKTASRDGMSAYVGGLAAWRLERTDEARHLFETAADAPGASPRLRAAAAFWASRAARRQQDPADVVVWLKRAAQERTTFHGLLARRILRMPIGIVPGGELLTQADVDAVAATPPGWRAFALLQIDQPDRADAELRTLWPVIQANPVFGRSVLLVASAAGLTDLAEQLAGLLQVGDGHRFDELRFPVPRLRPAGGFSIDPALVYALARTESNFDAGAVSAAGARGLMQLMPATADFVAGDLGLAPARLHDPAFNLAVGQRYVSYLGGLDSIGGDLIRLLASYNSGPGSFLRWSASIHDDDDPLLFIEAIPVAETRDFVQDVLAASWIYAARLHRLAPSLDSVAAGEFPRFTPLAGQGIIAAAASMPH